MCAIVAVNYLPRDVRSKPRAVFPSADLCISHHNLSQELAACMWDVEEKVFVAVSSDKLRAGFEQPCWITLENG